MSLRNVKLMAKIAGIEKKLNWSGECRGGETLATYDADQNYFALARYLSGELCTSYEILGKPRTPTERQLFQIVRYIRID